MDIRKFGNSREGNVKPNRPEEPPEAANATIADLMNIRRKALALTAEIDKILGLKGRAVSDKYQR